MAILPCKSIVTFGSDGGCRRENGGPTHEVTGQGDIADGKSNQGRPVAQNRSSRTLRYLRDSVGDSELEVGSVDGNQDGEQDKADREGSQGQDMQSSKADK